MSAPGSSGAAGGTARHSGALRIAFPDAAAAQRALAALAPDDAGHLRSRCDGPVLVLEAEAATPLGLLRTLDDALACLRAL